jgi:quinol monooxygenase YgiN
MKTMTYVIVARWKAREGEGETIASILRDLVPECRREPGVRQFIAHRSHDNPNDFLIYEQYENEQAFIDHQQTVHFKTMVLERAVPLLAHRERLPFAILD